MIGRLTGTLQAVDESTILVDVHGVGYEVEITASTRAALPKTGQSLTLCTHLIVREDGHYLYGFESRAERELFRTLIKVSGIGPRLALGVLSSIDAAEFACSVAANDVARLTRLPGIGRKTAERLVVELKDRLEPMLAAGPARAAPAAATPMRRTINEAEHALVALGYRPAEASRLISGTFEEGLSTEEIVRAALKQLASQEA